MELGLFPSLKGIRQSTNPARPGTPTRKPVPTHDRGLGDVHLRALYRVLKAPIDRSLAGRVLSSLKEQEQSSKRRTSPHWAVGQTLDANQFTPRPQPPTEGLRLVTFLRPQSIFNAGSGMMDSPSTALPTSEACDVFKSRTSSQQPAPSTIEAAAPPIRLAGSRLPVAGCLSGESPGRSGVMVCESLLL